MKYKHIGKRQQAILDFLEEPADEKLLELHFAPVRPKSKSHWQSSEYHKVRQTLAKMIAKGWIVKKGDTYEKALLLRPTRNTR